MYCTVRDFPARCAFYFKSLSVGYNLKTKVIGFTSFLIAAAVKIL